MQAEIFTLCDAATVTGGKLNILGSFDTIGAHTFPCNHPLCAVACKLRFDVGEEGGGELPLLECSPAASLAGENRCNYTPTMCGIVGYVGRAEAAPLLLDGLRRLEYRGYDSAGIAVVDRGHLETRKCAGRIAALA